MPPENLLEGVEAAGRLLALTVRGVDPSVRAWSPRGVADPEGYAGVGCIEALVHGWDVATGLGLDLEPPREVCDRLLARMFPAYGRTTEDAWLDLLRATGRESLPGQENRLEWRWDASSQPR